MPVAECSAKAIVNGLARLGLPPSRFGRGRIDNDEALAALWTRAIALSGRRSVPLEVGLGIPLGEMGVIDYLAASSASIGAALAVTQEVFPLVAPGVQLTIEKLSRERRRVAIVDQPPFVGQAESDLLVVGILLSRIRTLATRPLEPHIELVEHKDETRWRELLHVPRVRLGARRTALVLSAADWLVPVRSADPKLLELLRSVIGAEQRSLDALLVALRALARDRSPGSLTLSDAAASLGISRRTLQRKLHASGTSLLRVVDEVRRDLAAELAERHLYSLGEIATKVGFAEQASFTRAWIRWFGRAPSRGPR